MDLATDDIRYDVEPPVATITFDRPERHNALTFAMNDALVAALRDADDRDDVRAIVVTGAGDEAFCVGADLEEKFPGLDPEPGEDDIMFREERLTTPIVAAVNGYCVAAGMEFLQVTDIRIAEEHARFGLQEPRWGLAPFGGSHVRLPRQIPYCRAMEYLLTGDLFPASHALDAGLVNEVVPGGESLPRAREVAASIAENSPFAVARIKEAVQRCRSLPMDEAFGVETEISREVLEHDHATEGPRAFVEGREPSFRP